MIAASVPLLQLLLRRWGLAPPVLPRLTEQVQNVE